MYNNYLTFRISMQTSKEMNMITDTKEEGLYSAAKEQPKIVLVPLQKIVSAIGFSAPSESKDFQAVVRGLFSVSMALQKACLDAGLAYEMHPLEIQWCVEDRSDFMPKNKDFWQWKAFVVQPDCVSREMFDAAKLSLCGDRFCSTEIERINFESLNEGPCAQVLHVGPYESSGPAISRLQDFIRKQGYRYDKMIQKHHEIYLNDVREVPPEELLTIIRQPILKDAS